MSRETTIDPWNDAVSPTGAQSSRRAARWIWWIGSAEILIFTIFSASFANVASTPIDQIVKQLDGTVDLAQLELVHDKLWPVVALLLILGVAPGLAYLFLGFAIRRGVLVATRIGLVIAGTQAVVLAVFTANTVLTAILTLNPVAVSAWVVLLGTPTALLLLLVRALLRAQADQTYLRSIEADPWR